MSLEPTPINIYNQLSVQESHTILKCETSLQHCKLSFSKAYNIVNSSSFMCFCVCVCVCNANAFILFFSCGHAVKQCSLIKPIQRHY